VVITNLGTKALCGRALKSTMAQEANTRINKARKQEETAKEIYLRSSWHDEPLTDVSTTQSITISAIAVIGMFTFCLSSSCEYSVKAGGDSPRQNPPPRCFFKQQCIKAEHVTGALYQGNAQLAVSTGEKHALTT
jgi:hypothetical protein